MKKLFNFKNCLITLFCLSIIAYLIFNIINTTSTVNEYNNLLDLLNSSMNSSSNHPSIREQILIYRNTRNQFLTSLISNYIMLICIAGFLVALLSLILHKFNCLKFAFISLAFVLFALYISQISIQFTIDYNYSKNIKRVMIAITSLIALIIGIACYIYLLIREIQKRKRATQVKTQDATEQE